MRCQTKPFTVVRKGRSSEEVDFKAIVLRQQAFGEGATRVDVKAGIRR
jgi:hypothetical protein